jgi:heme-degrading monooxygenase HmoA
VAEWRWIEAHRRAKAAARREVFADYRQRVASVVRDYGMAERAETSPDSQIVDG